MSPACYRHFVLHRDTRELRRVGTDEIGTRSALLIFEAIMSAPDFRADGGFGVSRWVWDTHVRSFVVNAALPRGKIGTNTGGGAILLAAEMLSAGALPSQEIP